MKLRNEEQRKPKNSRALPILQRDQPKLPIDEEKVEELQIALGRMGCADLLDIPWGVQIESLIHDLIEPIANT